MAKIDIIIPVFKIDELNNTLNSLKDLNFINVFLIDDGVFNNYSSLIKKYSNINFTFFQLANNCGQGLARQYAFENCESKYVTFLDCGDEISDENSLDECIKKLDEKDFSYTDIYTVWKEENFNTLKKFGTLGQIYNINWIKKNNISFPFNDFCSHNLEDVCWYNLCCYSEILNKEKCALKDSKPVVIKNVNANSVSQGDKGLYHFKDHNKALTLNLMYFMNKINKVFGKGQQIDNWITYDISTGCLIACAWSFMECQKLHTELQDDAYYWFKYFLNKFYIQNYRIDINKMWIIYKKNFKTFSNYEKIEFNKDILSDLINSAVDNI